VLQSLDPLHQVGANSNTCRQPAYMIPCSSGASAWPQVMRTACTQLLGLLCPSWQ
jgi:hypothetical protein